MDKLNEFIISDVIELDSELEKCNKFNTSKYNNIKELHKAKVIKCYDGDTIHAIFKCNQTYSIYVIRLFGIDSWEIEPSKNSKNREEEIKKAKLAKQRLESLILDKIVYISCHGTEKYGRILGTIKINLEDEKTINTIMLEEGHAYVYFGDKKKEFVN